jgi:hypothetical protein
MTPTIYPVGDICYLAIVLTKGTGVADCGFNVP